MTFLSQKAFGANKMKPNARKRFTHVTQAYGRVGKMQPNKKKSLGPQHNGSQEAT